MTNEPKQVKELRELFKTLTIYGDSEIFDIVFLPKIKKDPYVALELARAVAQKTVDGCISKIIESGYTRIHPTDKTIMNEPKQVSLIDELLYALRVAKELIEVISKNYYIDSNYKEDLKVIDQSILRAEKLVTPTDNTAHKLSFNELGEPSFKSEHKTDEQDAKDFARECFSKAHPKEYKDYVIQKIREKMPKKKCDYPDNVQYYYGYNDYFDEIIIILNELEAGQHG